MGGTLQRKGRAVHNSAMSFGSTNLSWWFRMVVVVVVVQDGDASQHWMALRYIMQGMQPGVTSQETEPPNCH